MSSKLGGQSAELGGMWVVGRADFCFVISKWHVLVNYEVQNLKFFFFLSSISGVRVDSVADFKFSTKAMNKTHH